MVDSNIKFSLKSVTSPTYSMVKWQQVSSWPGCPAWPPPRPTSWGRRWPPPGRGSTTPGTGVWEGGEEGAAGGGEEHPAPTPPPTSGAWARARRGWQIGGENSYKFTIFLPLSDLFFYCQSKQTWINIGLRSLEGGLQCSTLNQNSFLDSFTRVMRGIVTL